MLGLQKVNASKLTSADTRRRNTESVDYFDNPTLLCSLVVLPLQYFVVERTNKIEYVTLICSVRTDIQASI